ncbi:light induced alcohol dehydrogenase Bli-4 [Apiospora saccharicola]|uniref:Light induced alcohol dehydrogenase Bli-4 n=1 Tax=Apiospora saccharicola TaxID=335842 RepID=A0ABR1TIN1_9PEZI
MSFASGWTQFFPPRNGAPLTESNLRSQVGKVFIVTGGSSGLGYHLSRVLYGAGGKVYLLTRTRQHADDAISRIKAHYHDDRQDTAAQRGSLDFIYMDLLDFATVKAAAEQFLELEGPNGRLDVLFNNAGTGAVSNAPKSKQGCEYHFCVNSIGTILLTRLLTPILSKTAAQNPKDTVRVVWPASVLVEMMSPKDGIRKTFLENPDSVTDQNELYSSSKTANWFLASEFSRRQVADHSAGTTQPRVVHIAGNPGQYVTNIWRSIPALTYYLTRPILRDPIHGMETYLWMAFSDSVTFDRVMAGGYAICDGRWHPGQREDLLLALKGVDQGGSGRASEYFDWCDAAVKDFVN